MLSDYWKEKEVQKDFKSWFEEYQGCLACGCDHGCNQWIKEQQYRTAIILKIFSNPKAITKLEKVTQIPLERINKIWYKLQYWDMLRFNKELRDERKRNNPSS